MDTRIDIAARSGLARTGTLAIDGRALRFPNVLYVSTPRVRPPSFAEAVIGSLDGEDGQLAFKDMGSVFMPPDGRGDMAIPPTIPYPHGVAEGVEMEPHAECLFHVLQSEAEIEIARARASKAAIIVWSHCMELTRRTRELSRLAPVVREGVGEEKLIYAPGLGLPHQLPLLAYCGVDLFDSLPVIEKARYGGEVSVDGFPPMNDGHCISVGEDHERILRRNYRATMDGLARLRSMIDSGSLREEVEHLAPREAWMTELLRFLDLEGYERMERHFPIVSRAFSANHSSSLHRPDVSRWRNRVERRYRKPPSADVLLLLPCSARKPYSTSRSHRRFAEAVARSGIGTWLHEVIVTSPMGLVPRELELFYPAQRYDVPVTGHWSMDERQMLLSMLENYLSHNKYSTIIAHLPEELRFICDALGDCVWTSEGPPTSQGSLRSLESTLRERKAPVASGGTKGAHLELMRNRAVFQFGEAGASLLEGAQLKGKYPNIRLLAKDCQIGMLVGERGMFSLTMEGARRLAEAGAYWVESDYHVQKGNLFAVAVTAADEEVRIGDDVVVIHQKEPIAVGVARMDGRQMVECTRGEAVHVRGHR